MSSAFRNVLDALLIAFLAFFIWLSSANARLNAESLKREREMPCYAPEQARQLSARCVVLSAEEVRA